MPLNRELLAKAKAALTKSAEKPGDDDASKAKKKEDPYKRDLPGYMKPETPPATSSEKPSTPSAQPTPEQPWTPEQLLQFARMGLNPKRLQFMQSLAGLRKGMNLESDLLDRALQGKLNQFGDEDSVLGGMPLGQFA